MKFLPEDFEMTPLVSYGLVFIFIVFGFLGLEKLIAAETEREQAVVFAQTEYATLQDISKTTHWENRLAESVLARSALQNEIWQGQTGGIIAAEFQQTLRQISADYRFEQIQVRVNPDPAEIDGIQVLSFDFSGRARTSKSLADFFERLAITPKIIVVDEMDFAQNIRDRQAPRLSMSGLIPVQIGR